MPGPRQITFSPPAFAEPTAGRPASERVDLLVVAGEHSGDEHAARMIRQARGIRPGLNVAALGGPMLEQAGAQVLHNLVNSSVVGVFEVLANYSFFRAIFNETIRWIETHRPRAVCLVDYPGFNLRLAAELRRRGLSAKGGGPTKVLYYISPQVWAWKSERRFAMARDLDALAVIFPFERDTYHDTELPVEFVGHPFVAPGYSGPVRYDPAGPILLLPGSRRQAVGRIFPALLAGWKLLRERDAVVLYPSDTIREVLNKASVGPPLAASRPKTDLRRAASGGPTIRFERTPGEGQPAFAAAAVLTSSGTMSMHCALAGIPGAIAYRANPLTYFLGRWLVRVPYLGIANLILGEPMYPEFIQGAARPEDLGIELRRCLQDRERQEQTRSQAAKLRRMLNVDTGGSAGEWLVRRVST